MKSNDPDLQWESEEEAVREKENPEECGVLDPGKESVSGRGREQLGKRGWWSKLDKDFALRSLGSGHIPLRTPSHLSDVLFNKLALW